MPQHSQLVEHRMERDVVPIDVIRDEFYHVLVVRIVAIRDRNLLAIVRIDAPRHKVEA